MDAAQQFLAAAKARAARSRAADVHPAPSMPGKSAKVRSWNTTSGQGAKAADDHRGDVSPASVPADDEAAIAAARASYQNAKMNTPEEKIRRAPATPMAPLSRDVQSVEILGGEGDKTTERDQKRSSDQKSKVNKKKGPLKARKTMRKHVKKAKKVKPTTKDGAKTTKTKEQTPATTPATRSTTTSPGTDASATPTPSTTGTTTGPGSAPQQPLRRPSVEIGSPDLTEICSPAPGAVAGVLNRAATGDLAQTYAVVKAGAQAALPPVGPHETRVRDGTRVRVRNKDYHNRRMRFYRSLDSTSSPSEIVKLGENARAGGGRKKSEKMAILFEEWTNCNGDWSTSSFVVRMRERTTEKQKGGRRWMTEGDIVDKYSKGRTVEEARQIARDIVMGKEACKHMRSTHIRPHPDAPLRQDMRLFLIWDEEFETTETDSIVEALFQCKDSDGHGKDEKKKKRKRETSSSSQSDKSSDSASSRSSSSSSDRRKNKKKALKKGKKSKPVKHKHGNQGKKKGKKEVKDESSDSDSKSESEDSQVAAGRKAKDEKEKQRAAEKEEREKQREAEKQAEKERKLAQKEEEKEKKRLESQQKKEVTKEINRKKGAAKKGVANLDTTIADTVRREQLSGTVADPDLRKALQKELQSVRVSLKQKRGQLQDALDNNEVDSMESLADGAKSLIDDYNKKKKAMQ